MNQLVNNYVPHQYNKIAIIGEAPGRDEENQGRPFVGYAGRLLTSILSGVGVQAQNCYMGNVSQYRPPDNDIAKFAWDGDEIQSGLEILAEDLKNNRPNLAILMGNVPLKAAKDVATNHPLIGKKFQYSVSNWRGSLFVCDDARSPLFGLKCMATYHPAACLRKYDWVPLLRYDLKRAAIEAATSNLVLPVRNLEVTGLTASDIVHRLDTIRQQRLVSSIDIEGGIGTMSCISVATAADQAFIVPFTGPSGNYFPTLEEEVNVWHALRAFLEDPNVPKVLQNSLYDFFVLAYSYKIIVRGLTDDTMLKHWEAYCELPKGLGFQCSLYTREPYYKHERESIGFQEHWTYCCRDSATTYEINDVLSGHLVDPLAKAHYKFNLRILNPMLYMELRGIRYDTVGAEKRRLEVLDQVYALNYKLDVGTSKSFDFSLPLPVAMDKVKAIVCKKRDAHSVYIPTDLEPAVLLKDYVDSCPTLIDLMSRWGSLTDTDKGHLNFILGTGVNIKSPEFKVYLYGPQSAWPYGNILDAPKQYDEKTGALTSNDHALLTIWKKTSNANVRVAIDLMRARTRSQMLSISADEDGRIRCGYNAVGTETGRTACYTSPTGSGYNLQTIPEYDRDLFLADEGYDMFSLDLSGADTWTVAAHLFRLGETTMLLDLRHGLKPAKILALMRRHGATVSSKDRDDLAKMSKEVQKSDWDYFACKVGVHGSNYLMGPITLAKNIFDESDGLVILSQIEIRELQNLYMLRYKVKKWHDATQQQLNFRPQLRSASGHLRHFFGRKDEILGPALSNEPQENTTYANNLALLRLWTDIENRRANGSLIIEPLHVVHDSIVGQWPQSVRDWARGKVRSYFDNPLTIAGMKLTIPFEGGWGPNWRETNNEV